MATRLRSVSGKSKRKEREVEKQAVPWLLSTPPRLLPNPPRPTAPTHSLTDCTYSLHLLTAPTHCTYTLYLLTAPTHCTYTLHLHTAPTHCTYYSPRPCVHPLCYSVAVNADAKSTPQTPLLSGLPEPLWHVAAWRFHSLARVHSRSA